MAFSSSISCPSCGVSVEGISAHTRSMECPHCSNWIYVSGSGWTSGGSFEHALDAPSMLRVGRSGRLKHDGKERRFMVAGRLRVSYSNGYWDEWWLEFDDGNHQWLEEDDGRYKLHTPVPANLEPAALQSAKVGGMLSIDGSQWFISEQLNAQLAGTEGSLPIVALPAEKIVCIDVMGNGEKLSVEASGHDVSVTRSVRIAGTDLVWDDSPFS